MQSCIFYFYICRTFLVRSRDFVAKISFIATRSFRAWLFSLSVLRLLYCDSASFFDRSLYKCSMKETNGMPHTTNWCYTSAKLKIRLYRTYKFGLKKNPSYVLNCFYLNHCVATTTNRHLSGSWFLINFRNKFLIIVAPFTTLF